MVFYIVYVSKFILSKQVGSMKKVFIILLLISLLAGCTRDAETQIAATTGPVYQFAGLLCAGTDIQVSQLITEEVSCLHDYTLQVSQMRAAEAAEVVAISGGGLEEFMEDVLSGANTVIDCSSGIDIMSYGENHDYEHEHDHGHDHGHDPHIWLSPANAKIMAQNLCNGLSVQYPGYKETFQKNLQVLLNKLDALQAYGEDTLSDLSCREMITFHDGFAYFAHSFDLTILEAVEEESGSEASAKELKHLINLVNLHQLPAVFTEINGSVSAANVIARETGTALYQLDMAISGNDYFASMYRNIDTVKEALG